MGQAQSVPRYEFPGAEIARASDVANPMKNQNEMHTNKDNDVKTKKEQEPLEKWTNDDRYSFELISPSSDLSNPSQFRHRQKNTINGNVGLKSNHPPVGARVQTSRNRTSKVCSKENPHTATRGIVHSNSRKQDIIPPPTRFYFQPETEKKRALCDNPTNNTSNATNLVVAKGTNEIHEQLRSHEKITLWKLHCLIWRAKIMKAKQILSDCWPNVEGDKVMELKPTFDQQDSTDSNERSDVGSGGKQKIQEIDQHAAYLQLEQTTFQPVWKEQAVVSDDSNMHITELASRNVEIPEKPKQHRATPYYMHSQDEYVSRIAVMEPRTTMKEDKLIMVDGRKSREMDETKTHEHVLFDGDNGRQVSSHSILALPRRSSVEEKRSKKPNKNSRPEDDGFDKRDESGLNPIIVPRKSGYQSDQTKCIIDESRKDRSVSRKESGKGQRVVREENSSKVQRFSKAADSATSKQLENAVVGSVGKENTAEDIQAIVKNRSANAASLETMKSSAELERKSKFESKRTPKITHSSELSNRRVSGSPASTELKALSTSSNEPATEKRSNKSQASTRLEKSSTEVAATSVVNPLASQNEIKSQYRKEIRRYSDKGQSKRKAFQSAKTIRQSHPPQSKRRSSTTSIASMLQQTYLSKSLISDDSSCDDDQNIKSRASDRPSINSMDYRQIALRLTASPINESTNKSGIANQCSPACSVDSATSTSSRPMLSEEVMTNAAFLFSPSYVGGDASKIKRARSSNLSISDSTGISISTLGSRNRLTSLSKPIIIPPRSSDCCDQGSYKSDRRVRFSVADLVDSMQIEVAQSLDNEILDQAKMFSEIPAIETKFSDLTDGTDSISTMQERELSSEAAEKIVGAVVKSDTCVLQRMPRTLAEHEAQQSNDLHIFEDVGDNDKMTPHPEHKVRWSYRQVNGLALGATPLIGGKSSLHATNSPYLRFQVAKSKFGGDTSNVRKSSNSIVTKKESPTKRRSSPIAKKAGNLVHARVTSMEAIRSKHADAGHAGRKSAGGPRHTTQTHDEVISRRSQISEETDEFEKNKGWEAISSSFSHSVSKASKRDPKSPAFKLGDKLGKDNSIGENHASKRRSLSQDTTSSDIYDDVFGQLRQASSIESHERDGSNSIFYRSKEMLQSEQETESEADVFDEFLQDDSEKGSDTEKGSVATIRQTWNGNSNVIQALRFRSSFGDSSTACSALSNTDVGSVATIRQRRDSIATVDENSTFSGISQLQRTALTFREEAPVMPSQLNHFGQPGSLFLSPTQRTPVQARKWRALAAAAHERDSERTLVGGKLSGKRVSLAERNPNTLGR